jgi:hypothetical protein
MSTHSTRTLAALAFERHDEFDPALTLPSAARGEECRRYEAAISALSTAS